MTRHVCRDMIERSGVRIMQFDATKASGITEWRKVVAQPGSRGQDGAGQGRAGQGTARRDRWMPVSRL